MTRPIPPASTEEEACYLAGEFVSETHTTNAADGDCVVCGVRFARESEARTDG